ncbi:hypothetical protein IMG5_130970 [Ichthyophthirius multifiliis]|uniref:Uncharacterized protein n=1 Tax=Ichthyophthirius multifiliis TaxID=5932 RepID=G0QWC4_ICHMU|nr:hypothetical protein IMG5_130970 [Ichthyophthirius multifiliis]EGR30471.1 hypothetical protein IMG5_130970 [Ichthyophthirius multifiliis]|eukprot:XP_004032058.1 hypothetical protein IMG5_130970 [Ichthyophthirius multifiliis]
MANQQCIKHFLKQTQQLQKIQAMANKYKQFLPKQYLMIQKLINNTKPLQQQKIYAKFPRGSKLYNLKQKNFGLIMTLKVLQQPDYPLNCKFISFQMSQRIKMTQWQYNMRLKIKNRNFKYTYMPYSLKQISFLSLLQTLSVQKQTMLQQKKSNLKMQEKQEEKQGLNTIILTKLHAILVILRFYQIKKWKQK